MADSVKALFAANHIIIVSIYGQVFFVLGLAIALQSWRHSRLMLARSLQWLAAFGLAHAFYEWGDIFIPAQATQFPAPAIELLLTLQVVLLALSFACLFQFGIEAMRPLPRAWRLLRYLPAALLIIWSWLSFGPLLWYARDTAEWHVICNVAARYSIGLPGGLLAAYGLYREGRRLAEEMHTPNLVRQLHVAGLALAGYALLAGLIVRSARFFPANWLNTDVVEGLIVLPVPVVRSLLGLILTLAIIRSLEVFRVELDRRLGALEEGQVLAAERERIGRELHDGTMQTIYAAGLLLQAAARELPGASEGLQGPPASQAPEYLEQSMALLNQAVADIRAYIGGLRGQPDSKSLAAALHELAAHHQLRSLAEVDVDADVPDGCTPAPARLGHLLAIAGEALSNVARHARATRVRLTARVEEDLLHLEIADNGRGMRPDYVMGYGLRNMRDRARLLGGDLSVVSRPGRGTTLRVIVPWCAGEDMNAQIVVS